MSDRHETVIDFLRGCGQVLAREMADDPEVAMNVAIGLDLAAELVAVEVDMNNRMAQCLIDSVSRGVFQEDAAIACLIDWKKARTHHKEEMEDDGCERRTV